jgi:hypothetical protein
MIVQKSCSLQADRPKRAFLFSVSSGKALHRQLDDMADSSLDAPRVIMWATLLVGLGAAGYELTKGDVEVALLVAVGGLAIWAALRVLLQIRAATAED